MATWFKHTTENRTWLLNMLNIVQHYHIGKIWLTVTRDSIHDIKKKKI